MRTIPMLLIASCGGVVELPRPPETQPAGVFLVHYEATTGSCGDLADSTVFISPGENLWGCDCHMSATCSEQSAYADGQQKTANVCLRDAGGRSIETVRAFWASAGPSAIGTLTMTAYDAAARETCEGSYSVTWRARDVATGM